MISSKRLKSGLASTAMVLIAIALLLPVNAWSQIEEIIVTARKKEESLQDVPLAVTAFAAEEIERRGIRTQVGCRRNEAAAVLSAYARKGGPIYHPGKG